jgi:hypothetical protein
LGVVARRATIVSLLVVVFSMASPLLQKEAHAGVGRVRWRGVEAQSGTPPPRLEAATAAHLQLALRPLGAALVPGPPFDAEAVARCTFVATARRAQCQVEVVAGQLRAERRGDVPFRDADDLAESIALLVTGLLQSDFADLPSLPEPEPEPPKPPPQPPPPPVLPPEAQTPPPTQTRPQTPTPTRTQTPTQTRTQTQTPTPTRTAGAQPLITHARSARQSLLLSVGPSVAVGFSGEPALWGASMRALYLTRAVVRVGGSVTFEGTDLTRSGFDLSFFRMTAAPRIGVGYSQGRVDIDLGVGPALHVLYGRTRDGAYSHTLTSLAGIAGARLGVGISPQLALEAGLDVVGSLQDERVAAGPTLVTRFGRWWLDVAIALVYRR